MQQTRPWHVHPETALNPLAKEQFKGTVFDYCSYSSNVQIQDTNFTNWQVFYLFATSLWILQNRAEKWLNNGKLTLKMSFNRQNINIMSLTWVT